jgi:hypothetical protein
MTRSFRAFQLLPTVWLAVALAVAPAPVRAACVIPASPCYPWNIPEGDDETILLEIIPNNTVTGAVYRVCLCPPTKGVSIVFDFKEGTRTLGTISRTTDAALCRDYRFQTTRSSTLKVRRTEAGKELVEGCYMTY